MEIREVSYGIANNFGEYIEINKHLKVEEPKLYYAILDHELSHTNKKGFTKEDFLIDIGPSKVNYFKLIVFMVRHPKSLTQFLPVYYQKKEIVYDINMLIAWVVMLSLVGIGVYLTFIL